MWRRTLPLGLSLIVGLLWVLVLEAVAAELPRVRLITTGGTISNRPGDRLSPAELIASVPDLDEFVEGELEEFANVSSSALTLEQWLHLSRRLNAVFAEDPDLAGVVLTSGTDTLEELAYFLHLTVRHERPVVVVGSMRRPGDAGIRRRGQPAPGVPRGRRPRLAGAGRPGHPQRRNQLRPGGHQDRRVAPADV